MSATKKIEDALEHIRLAEKSMKTGLLKWRPDYEIASDEYQKAATCYRNAKSYDQCRECLMKAADCHMQHRSLFHAARCFEQIILILKEQNNLLEIESFGHRACKLYQQSGSPEAAASALDKAAKIIEHTYPDNALNLYQHAVEVVKDEGNPRQAAEYCTKISRILVRLKRYDQAADAIRREICYQNEIESAGAIGRLTVALVLVQLAREDSVAAEKAFKEWGNNCDASEAQTMEMLLQAYDDEDPETAKRALNSPFIKHMDVEYARLARDLPLPQGMPAMPPKKPVMGEEAPTLEEPAPSGGLGGGMGGLGGLGGISGAGGIGGIMGGGEEEEDEDGGLC